jgi:phenylalanyl-tRNA synthetase beta chain
LFENIKFNQSRYDEIDIFEIGSVYFDFGGEFLKVSRNQEKLLHQEKRLAIAIAHQNADKAMSRVKGILEHLLGNFGLSAIFEEAEELVSWSAPGLCAKIEVREMSLGNVSLLSPKIGNKIGIKKSVAIAEISFQDLYRLASLTGGKRYQELPKFPPLARDLAFVVDKKILYNKIKQEIESFDNLISAVELFDVYEGEKLGSGKKNLAFHIIYQADRTLTGEEVDRLQKKLSQYLEKKFGAQIRDF